VKGRTNVEAGLQTGLDVIATMALWDRNSTSDESAGEVITVQGGKGVTSIIAILGMLIITTVFCLAIWRQEKEIFSGKNT